MVPVEYRCLGFPRGFLGKAPWAAPTNQGALFSPVDYALPYHLLPFGMAISLATSPMPGPRRIMPRRFRTARMRISPCSSSSRVFPERHGQPAQEAASVIPVPAVEPHRIENTPAGSEYHPANTLNYHETAFWENIGYTVTIRGGRLAPAACPHV